MEQWGARVSGGHFREGRSAYSLADFILNRDGAAILESRLSSEYDEKKGRVNQEVYEKFIEAANGKTLTQSPEGPRVHEITAAGKRLICIYDYFQFP